jgi:predicted 2-oxoglutarate/Fe(II)-dependent dioxygenase YbiX
MKVAEGIYTLPNVLSPEECAQYIALTEAKVYEPAPISTYGGFEMAPEIRNNTRVIVDDFEIATNLWNRVRDEIPPLLTGRQAIGLNERFRFYRYDPGQKFAAHFDGSYRRENGEASLLTFMIYLNEGFTGGETWFKATSITPSTGMALVFNHDLLHEGKEVISGRKYVLRSDVMYGRVDQTRD